MPPEYVDFYRLLPLGPVSQDGRLFAASPLPRIAAHHYSTGGCFVLAGALEALTGLPLGATLDAEGLPRHAFLVHGPDFVDAFGRQQLAELRARPESVELRESLTLREIVDLLASHPNAGKIRGDLASEESRCYAIQAARLVLSASNFTAPYRSA